jgi:hypothetical protein
MLEYEMWMELDKHTVAAAAGAYYWLVHECAANAIYSHFLFFENLLKSSCFHLL